VLHKNKHMSIAFEGPAPNSELRPDLPSGYNRVEQYPVTAQVDSETLPWLQEPTDLTLARCTLDSGESFLMANVVGTNDRLIQAAKGLSEQQTKNVNNMFYSRLPQYVSEGHSPAVDTMVDVVTPFPIKVMRNNGGQRVYFGVTQLQLADGDTRPVLLRIGACDKNKQALVIKTIANGSAKKIRAKMSGSK
jgi:hypothetical protein